MMHVLLMIATIPLAIDRWWLPLILCWPLLATLLLACFRHSSRRRTSIIGIGSIALAAAMVIWFSLGYLLALKAYLPGSKMPVALVHHLWTWIEVDQFKVVFGYRFDLLSLTMLCIITGVGFLIHLFARWYIPADLKDRPPYAYSRFFCYMNLFIFSMLVLVMANDLLVLFLGWEGVGLCSYLLIGFYYRENANAWAAFKAFIVTRIGDVFLAIGLFLLWLQFQTLDIQMIAMQAPYVLTHGSFLTELTAFMLLGGALGKSAQVPLHTWLADAMAGPTPVSALIHAATMVTAGVYLIARMHVIFDFAPLTMELVALIGLITLLIAGFAALAQTDIKRILAYSTMSQLGYMFLALGVHAYDAAIFHLMMHAFFKALLFLAAGSVIIACHHEQNIFKMGGLARQIPLTYCSFIVGGAALAALPLVTAGFYSKDEILWLSFITGHGLLWLGGLFGALLTSVYTFRLILIVFHGKPHLQVHKAHGWAHNLPLCVLIVLSTFIGPLFFPPVADILPHLVIQASGLLKIAIEILTTLVALFGVLLALILFTGQRRLIDSIVASETGGRLWRIFNQSFGFDRLYQHFIVKPYLQLSRWHQTDWIDALWGIWLFIIQMANYSLTTGQNGRVRFYAKVFVGGVVILTIVLVIL